MSELLERALADLAEYPDSTARQVAQRLGADDRDLFDVLDHAAYAGKVRRWREGGARSAWRWEIPGTPRRCTKCARSGGELTENGCPHSSTTEPNLVWAESAEEG